MGDFRWDVHTSLFLRSLLKPGLPMQYTTADTQRYLLSINPIGEEIARQNVWLTLVYFCVTGLDLLGKLDNLSESDNAAVKKWVLSQQVRSAHIDAKPGGAMDEGNLAMTYSALATLVALGGDIAGVGGEAILQELRSLQQQDGRASTGESDWRQAESRAVSLLPGLQDKYSVNGEVVEATKCLAGSTYCAVASMELMGVLHGLSPARREGLVEWCVNRQRDGFQSRPNKVSSDSCCSFWVGATLDLLGEMGLVDRAPARQFHMSCQNKVLGGFAKAPDLLPDLLHSFYSVAWLSLSQELEAEEIDVSLGITKRARALLPL